MEVFMKVFLIILIVILLALVGFLVWIIIESLSPPILMQGEVYEKEFIPAHNQVMTIPIVITNGKTTSTILIPYMYYYSDTWVIRIKDFQGNKWITEDFYVSKEVYDVVNIGNEFKYEPNRGDLNDQPYTREKVETLED